MSIIEEDMSDLMADDRMTMDLLGNIRTYLQSYSGEIIIVRELAQNTDDVPGDDRWLELHFDANTLRVRNNTLFLKKDFVRLRNIGVGGKRTEEHRTTGTFGVGFVSVYQLTDTPILRSNGHEVRFDPAQGKAPMQPYATEAYTEFELPYRRVQTETGRALEMDAVTADRLQHLIATQLPQELPTLLLFTERLSRITVFQGGQQIFQVHRVIETCSQAQIERIAIHIEQPYQTSHVHHWLRFTGLVDDEPVGCHSRKKDGFVQIAVPDQDVPKPFWHGVGRLYMYLPTNITTQLPFHINGDFYPSAERKTIDNGHESHRVWNHLVLKAIGACYAAALPSLLEHVATEPQALYQRLPLQIAELLRQAKVERTLAELVEPITRAFLEAARALPIFATLGGWRTAEDTRWVGAALRGAAGDVDARLMTAPLQTAAQELITAFGVQEYTLADHLRRIAADVTPGTLLTAGPAYLNTPAQLDALYAVFEQHDRTLEEQIKRTPVFLDHAGRLWQANDCVRCEDKTLREGLAASGLHFWTGDAGRFRTATLVPTFALPALWRVLEAQLPHNTALRDAPLWLNSRAKMNSLYDLILRSQHKINSADVGQLGLCLDRDEMLRVPSAVFLPDRPLLYDILEEDTDAPLVARALYNDSKRRELYHNFGVKMWGWEELIKRLDKLAKNECALTEAHPALNSREKLIRIYRYLSEQRANFEEKHRHELRRLPMWLCEDRLRLAKDLALPPDTSDWPSSIKMIDVIPFKRGDGLHPLLDEKLGLKPLDPARFIKECLLPQYGALNTKAQKEALTYLRNQEDLIRNTGDLLSAVQATPLIYGDDRRLYKAADLCFPGSPLLNLLPSRFHVRLHDYYEPPKDDITSWRWYSLFRTLGVNQHAPVSVIVEEVDKLTRRKPHETKEQVERIFRYVEEHWERVYANKNLGAKLRDRAWLPAEGDDTRWYRPSEVYTHFHRAYVDQIATILDFKPDKFFATDFATALGFQTPDTAIAVKQLLRLSAREKAPTEALYTFLSQRLNTGREEIKKLRGQAVIYDRDQKHYRKPTAFFLTNQKREFGDYYSYAVGTNLHALFRELGAREQPEPKDYVDLITQIAKCFSGQALPNTEVALLTNAYTRLAGAEHEALTEPLRHLACVVSKAGDEEIHLRLPQAVLFPPPERYEKHLPNLPIAHAVPARGRAAAAAHRRARD